jgi:DNA polymerase
MIKSNLDIVKQDVINCTKCELCKTRTNSVPGKGNFHSDVIFVGEAPGRNEDLHGEPFVGVAGKKLSLALENAGISRDEVYITNTVKCRPPNNRVPSKTERETCQEYIQKEIEIIKPKIICVLGRRDRNYKIPWKNWQKRKSIVFYHHSSSSYNLQSRVN